MSKLGRNILSGAILAIGNGVIIFVSYPLYLKYLGTDGYGVWTTLSVVINFSSISGLGVDTAIIKYVAEEYGKKSKSGVEKYFSTAIIVLLVTGIIIFLALLPFAESIVRMMSIPELYIPDASRLFPMIVALSVFIFLVRVTNGALKGLGSVDLANYYDLGGRSIAVISTVIFLYFGYGLFGVFWGQVLFYTFLGGISYFTIYRILGNSFFSVSSFDRKYLRKMIGFGGTMTAARLTSMFLRPFNKLVIARYINISAVTYYDIADKIVMNFRNLFQMGIGAIMPEVSRLSVSEDSGTKVEGVFKKAMKLVIYAGIPMFAALFVLGPTLLRWWIPKDYTQEMGNAFRIILSAYLINTMSLPIYFLFMGTGKVKYCFVNHLVSSALNITLILIFIGFSVTGFYLFVSIFSISIALSAILLIAIFLMLKNKYDS